MPDSGVQAVEVGAGPNSQGGGLARQGSVSCHPQCRGRAHGASLALTLAVGSSLHCLLWPTAGRPFGLLHLTDGETDSVQCLEGLGWYGPHLCTVAWLSSWSWFTPCAVLSAGGSWRLSRMPCPSWSTSRRSSCRHSTASHLGPLGHMLRLCHPQRHETISFVQLCPHSAPHWSGSCQAAHSCLHQRGARVTDRPGTGVR